MYARIYRMHRIVGCGQQPLLSPTKGRIGASFQGFLMRLYVCARVSCDFVVSVCLCVRVFASLVYVCVCVSCDLFFVCVSAFLHCTNRPNLTDTRVRVCLVTLVCL